MAKGMVLVLFCALLCACAPMAERAASTTEATGDPAYDAYRAGDYGQAFDLWRERAEAGDADAQVNLGHLYERGLGVMPDRAAALAWYRRAAERGDAPAQYQVGLMHELGLGVSADAGAAEYWYRRAIDQGYCPGELATPDQVRPLWAHEAGEGGTVVDLLPRGRDAASAPGGG